MDVQLSVEDNVGWEVAAGEEVGEDSGVPEVFVAGLEFTGVAEGTDAVELGLDVKGVRDSSFEISIVLR